MAIDFGEKALDVDSKAMQQINLTGILNQRGGATIFSNIEETKKTILDFFIRNPESIVNLFCFSMISI